MNNLYLELKIEEGEGKEVMTYEAKPAMGYPLAHLKIPRELCFESKYVLKSLSYLNREKLR